jgi:hypothetical protein
MKMRWLRLTEVVGFDKAHAKPAFGRSVFKKK